MRKSNKIFPIIKVILGFLGLLLISGVGVMAVTSKVSSIDITLSDGYKLTVLSNKTKVEDILKENNILIGENEKVTPSQDKNISENKTIVISNKSKQEIEIAKVSESGIESTLDSLLQAYDTIIEKIETVQEEIPFETVKKDISNGAKSTKNQVLQQGKNGVKEITYKVKYQNETEIERTKISEKIIKKPVNKIVQIKSNVVVTSRSSDSSRISNSNAVESDGSAKIFKVTAYCPCSKCCGSWANGITAMGTTAQAGKTVAAPKNYAFGTKLLINGKEYVVEDRGGAIKGNRIDIYVNSHAEALRWGVKYLPVKVIN